MKLAHYATLIAACLSAAITAYLTHGGQPLVVGGVSVFSVLLTVLALFQQPPKPPAPPTVLHTILGLVLCASVAATPGCKQLEADFPIADAVLQVVAADFAAGDSDAQIAADVCKALGGTDATDQACADVGEVVQAAVDMLLLEGKLTGAQHERAKAYQAAHAHKAAQ